jgi:hypothetical protein
MKNAHSKKNQKFVCINGEDNTGSEGQSSSCNNISEDDNASQENSSSGSKSVTLNSNGKTRASRGSATDPQSLYARVINYFKSRF